MNTTTIAEQIRTALANEARRSELRQKIASLKGAVDATSSAMQKLSSVNSDNVILLTESQRELAALEAGAGPGVTADYGPKSAVTQLVEIERAAAKGAVVDYVKDNPSCTEDEAAGAWNAAALAATGFSLVLQDAKSMSTLYRLRLFEAEAIPENTWEAQRNWILITARDTIMSM